MIYPDITSILEKYCDWDDDVRVKHLQYADTLISKHHRIIYKNVEYHHIEDLKVDLEAECLEMDSGK